MDRRRKSVVLLHKVIALKSTQIFLVASIVLLTLFITLMCVGFLVRYEVDSDVSNVNSVSYWEEKMSAEQKIWYDKGIEELRRALRLELLKDKAKNVVIFVGHGFQPNILAATRFTKGSGIEQDMIWDKFPHIAKLKNSCSNEENCDSFTFSTSLYGGVKTNRGLGGLDIAADLTECDLAQNYTHRIKSILEEAQDMGLRTGIVTNGRLTAPTIAALYAHVPNTQWECDVDDLARSDCLDVATQLFAESPGIDIDVIMGGGRQILVASTSNSTEDPIDEAVCRPNDGRDYLRLWRLMRRSQKQRHSLVQSAEELSRLNASELDYVLGVFGNTELSTEGTMPQLGDMATKAVEVLKNTETGFLLVVETIAEVEDNSEIQIKKLLQLNQTISQISNSLSSDTLLIVLFAQNYESEMNNTMTLDDDILLSEITSVTFNGDSMLYAAGPESYLFQTLHEETYMAHVVRFALNMGQFNPDLKDAKRFTTGSF